MLSIKTEWIDDDCEKAPSENFVLVEKTEFNYGTVQESLMNNGKYWPGNMLIHGDNQLAIETLEHDFNGQIDCIYIDPPYNTGSNFCYYGDNKNSAVWLDEMYHKLNVLHHLLKDTGAICIQIDSRQLAPLTIILDQIFDKKNFVNIITVKTKIAGVSGSNMKKSLQDNAEYLLVYAKDVKKFSINEIPCTEIELMTYIDEYNRQNKSWKYTSVLSSIDDGINIGTFMAGNGDEVKIYRHKDYEIKPIQRIARDKFDGNLKEAYYSCIDKVFRTTNAQTSIRTKLLEHIENYDGGKGIYSIEYTPCKGRNAGHTIRSYYKDKNLVAWLKDVVSFRKDIILKRDNLGNIWDDVQYNNLTKEGDVRFPNGKKPEMLVGRIIKMLSKPGDVVLDCFLGSGTTASVACKLGRRYIGIEIGDHIYTHCVARLKRVIDREDSGGIDERNQLHGDCGFRFYEIMKEK